MRHFKVALGRLLSKSAYKVDFLRDKRILYKRFLLYCLFFPSYFSFAKDPPNLQSQDLEKIIIREDAVSEEQAEVASNVGEEVGVGEGVVLLL